MHISINTDEGLSDLDRSILSALVGNGAAPVAAAAQTSSTKASATPAAAAAAAVPDEPEGPSLQDAIDAATAVVGAGNPQLVKAALTQASPDTAKVSALPAGDIPAFLAALEAQVAAAENPL